MLRLVFDFASRAYAKGKRMLDHLVFERPTGLDTGGIVQLEDLGLAAEEREDYYPTPWLALRKVLSGAHVRKDDVFIDFGCGKGRVLYHAAMHPFRRVIGVEISPALAAIARKNIESALPKLKCRDVEVVNDDVLNYSVPDDVTFVYFFDPFHGDIFAAVVDKLVESVRRRPRTLKIIYFDPHEEEALLKAGATLVKATRGLRPTRKWAQEKSIRVYHLGPAPAA